MYGKVTHTVSAKTFTTRGACRPKVSYQRMRCMFFMSKTRGSNWIFNSTVCKMILNGKQRANKPPNMHYDHHATLHEMSSPENFNLPQINTKTQICISLAFSAKSSLEKRQLTARTFLCCAPHSSRDKTGDKGFILKTDYCFLTAQCPAFNPMDRTGWIALLILSFPTATAGSEATAVWGSSSITVLHQSRDVNQKQWRNTPHRTSVTDILSTEYVTHCWATVDLLA